MDRDTVSAIFSKLDEISKDTSKMRENMAALPCGIHKERFKELNRIWTFIIIIISGLVTLAWKAFK